MEKSNIKKKKYGKQIIIFKKQNIWKIKSNI